MLRVGGSLSWLNMLPIVMVLSLRSALARNCPVGASAFSFAVLPEDEDRDMSGLVVVSEISLKNLKGFDWEPLHLLSDPWFDLENNIGPLCLKRYCQISCWSLL